MIRSGEIDFEAHFSSLKIHPNAAKYLANRLEKGTAEQKREFRDCWRDIFEEKMRRKQNSLKNTVNSDVKVKCEPSEDLNDSLITPKINPEVKMENPKISSDEAKEMRGWIVNVVQERTNLKEISYDNSQWDFILDPRGDSKKLVEEFLDKDGNVSKKISLSKFFKGNLPLAIFFWQRGVSKVNRKL